MITVDFDWKVKEVEIVHMRGCLELLVSLENGPQILSTRKCSVTLALACSEAFQGLLEGYCDNPEQYIFEITDTHFRLSGTAVVKASLTLPNGFRLPLQSSLRRQDSAVAGCLALALVFVDFFRGLPEGVNIEQLFKARGPVT
jgi:hypothetical protein